MRYLVNKFVVIMVMVALFVLVSASCDNVDIRMLMKKEVPFISKDINQAKELKLFLAEYNVLTVNTKTNLPVFIDEVWFEKKHILMVISIL